MMPHSALFFDSGGLRCAADLYWPPDTQGPVPCVVMGHGFSGTKDMGLAPYAERFATAYIGTGFEQIVADEVAFLRRHVLAPIGECTLVAEGHAAT